MKLYKFLRKEHAEDFITQGKVLFGSLTKYINAENASIADLYEGRRKYATQNKLKVTQGDKTLADYNFSFESYVNTNDIFAFCTSYSSDTYFREYNTCIEITDHKHFAERIIKSFKKRKISFHHGKVHYYTENDPLYSDWALPEKISFSKLHRFNNEKEYRFVFCLTDALEFGRTKQILTTAQPLRGQNNYPERILKLGNLSELCKII